MISQNLLDNDDIDGRCDIDNRWIIIRPGLPELQAQEVLLHEMCHASGLLGHGKQFQEKLLRVSRAVADDGEKELAKLVPEDVVRHIFLEQHFETKAEELMRSMLARSPLPPFSTVHDEIVVELKPMMAFKKKTWLRKRWSELRLVALATS